MIEFERLADKAKSAVSKFMEDCRSDHKPSINDSGDALYTAIDALAAAKVAESAHITWDDDGVRKVNGVRDYAKVAGASSAEPVGWKLVPVEPTIGMCMAGDKARLNQNDPTRTAPAYRAMLAAAPTPSDPQAEKTNDAIATAARFARLYSIARRLRWHQHGLVSTEGDSGAAMRNLCEFLFADGMDEALAAHPSAQPASALQPMTEEQIGTENSWASEVARQAFTNGVRFAERAHGIGDAA